MILSVYENNDLNHLIIDMSIIDLSNFHKSGGFSMFL